MTAESRPGCRVLVVHGKIMFDTRQELDDAIKAALADSEPRIVVDLHGVALCDSTGLQLLIDGLRQATQAGGWLRLCRPQPIVERVFEITNLTTILPLYDSVDAAVSGDGPPGSGAHSRDPAV